MISAISPGFALFETNDPQAMASWALNWNNVLDFKTVVVLDDAEPREVGKRKTAELSSAASAADTN